MHRRIRFTFPTVGASAVATLLEDAAPKTCEAVWSAMPVAGSAHHAIYSGSEAVLLLPRLVRAEPENATADVRTGDIAFAWFDAGSSFGVTEAFAEICWFYDADGRPSMPEGPVPVNIFARFEAGSAAFFDACRRMRRAGITTLLVERVQDDAEGLVISDIEHSIVFREPHAWASAPVLRSGEELSVTLDLAPNATEIDGSATCVRASGDGLAWREAASTDGEIATSSVRLPGGAELAIAIEGREIRATLDNRTATVRVLPSDDAGDVSAVTMPNGDVVCVYRCFDGAAPDQIDATSAAYAARFRVSLKEDA